MGLEHWDPHRRKWILYQSQDQHSRDCEIFPYRRIPRRIFLDTNVVNLLVKHHEQIIEHVDVPGGLDETKKHDLEALMHVFDVAQRASWEVVTSDNVINEIERIKNPDVRNDILDYATQLVQLNDEDGAYAMDLGRRLKDASFTARLPDIADRELIGNAIGLKCDVFCTCDRKTIVRKRDSLGALPIRILTPVEWWSHVKPWAGLW